MINWNWTNAWKFAVSLTPLLVYFLAVMYGYATRPWYEQPPLFLNVIGMASAGGLAYVLMRWIPWTRIEPDPKWKALPMWQRLVILSPMFLYAGALWLYGKLNPLAPLTALQTGVALAVAAVLMFALGRYFRLKGKNKRPYTGGWNPIRAPRVDRCAYFMREPGADDDRQRRGRWRVAGVAQ